LCGACRRPRPLDDARRLSVVLASVKRCRPPSPHGRGSGVLRVDGEVHPRWCSVRRSPQRWFGAHGFASFSLSGGMVSAFKCGGCGWHCGRARVVLQGSGRSWWTLTLLGRAGLSLRLSHWVGCGGRCRQSAERSCGFVVCASGGLVVGLGGGVAAPSVLLWCAPCRCGRVVNFVYMSFLCVW
jgi:hypothetical protein